MKLCTSRKPLQAGSQCSRLLAHMVRGGTVTSYEPIVGEIKAKQTSFEAKYDRNQEENQRVFRQILAAVKS